MTRALRVVPDGDAVSLAAAEHIVALARAAVEARGRFTIALSGGSTPRATYARLASAPLVDRMPWQATEFFFGDERWVPPDDARSNFALVREAMFARAPVTPTCIHMVNTLCPTPGDSARAYESRLRERVPDGVVDLALLGLGPDGHTASLFPGSPVLNERVCWVAGVDAPTHVAPHVARVTMTLPVLDAARAALFLVTGSEKRDVLRRVLDGDPHCPAARVHSAAIVWLVDEAAHG